MKTLNVKGVVNWFPITTGGARAENLTALSKSQN